MTYYFNLGIEAYKNNDFFLARKCFMSNLVGAIKGSYNYIMSAIFLYELEKKIVVLRSNKNEFLKIKKEELDKLKEKKIAELEKNRKLTETKKDLFELEEKEILTKLKEKEIISEEGIEEEIEDLEKRSWEWLKIASGVNDINPASNKWEEKGLSINKANAICLLATKMLEEEKVPVDIMGDNNNIKEKAYYLLKIAAENGSSVAAEKLLNIIDEGELNEIAEYEKDLMVKETYSSIIDEIMIIQGILKEEGKEEDKIKEARDIIDKQKVKKKKKENIYNKIYTEYDEKIINILSQENKENIERQLQELRKECSNLANGISIISVDEEKKEEIKKICEEVLDKENGIVNKIKEIEELVENENGEEIVEKINKYTNSKEKNLKNFGLELKNVFNELMKKAEIKNEISSNINEIKNMLKKEMNPVEKIKKIAKKIQEIKGINNDISTGMEYFEGFNSKLENIFKNKKSLVYDNNETIENIEEKLSELEKTLNDKILNKYDIEEKLNELDNLKKQYIKIEFGPKEAKPIILSNGSITDPTDKAQKLNKEDKKNKKNKEIINKKDNKILPSSKQMAKDDKIKTLELNKNDEKEEISFPIRISSEFGSTTLETCYIKNINDLSENIEKTNFTDSDNIDSLSEIMVFFSKDENIEKYKKCLEIFVEEIKGFNIINKKHLLSEEYNEKFKELAEKKGIKNFDIDIANSSIDELYGKLSQIAGIKEEIKEDKDLDDLKKTKQNLSTSILPIPTKNKDNKTKTSEPNKYDKKSSISKEEKLPSSKSTIKKQSSRKKININKFISPIPEKNKDSKIKTSEPNKNDKKSLVSKEEKLPSSEPLVKNDKNNEIVNSLIELTRKQVKLKSKEKKLKDLKGKEQDLLKNKLSENKNKVIQLITESNLKTLKEAKVSLKDKIDDKNKENDKDFFEALEKVTNAIDAAISKKTEKSI